MLRKCVLGSEYSDADDVEEEVCEGGDDHGKERAIVESSYTVVDPHAVVIKILYATSCVSCYRSQALQCRDFSLT